MSYSEGLSEGSPNRLGVKTLGAADFKELQNNISQLITGLNQLKTSGVGKQDFENLCTHFRQLTVDCEGTQRFQTQCNETLEKITTTSENLTESFAAHRDLFEELKAQVQGIADVVNGLGEPPSKEDFDNLFNEVRKIDGKVDTLNQEALEEAQLGDAVAVGRAGEHHVDVDNDGTGAIHLHEVPETDLTGDQYRRFPRNMGRNLPAIHRQAVQGGGQAPASLGATSQTHTHGSQRTQAAANDEQFWVHIKFWEINRDGARIRGGQELMPIKFNSTLRDPEIQVENYVKNIQKGDISKRSNLQEPNVFYWSTEHVVDNIKAMKDMDADENMWGSTLGDGAVTINENNDIGIMD